MSLPKLVIVESPSKAKTISKYLGNDYVVRPTVGHIMDLDKGKGGNIGINIAKGFVPKYVDLFDKKDVIKTIQLAAKNSSEIIIASDPDREGEAIAFHVANKIKSLNKPIHRAEFHEITKKGVKKGLNNLRPLDNSLYDAQQARRVLDRIVGFMVSPYLINKMKQKLSAGRVQSVALRLIVDREREIENFKPEEYFTIKTTLSTSEQEEFIAEYPKKLRDKQTAQNITKHLKNSKYKVIDVEKKQQKKPALPPFNTADLQKAASIHLKFSADKTIKTAQALYEKGFVSYIRTDSYRVNDDTIKEARDYLSSEGYNIPSSPNKHKNKDASQDAHEAIRPTKPLEETPDTFIGSEDEKNLYILIWQRFIASQMNPVIYDIVNVKIEAECENKKEIVKAAGKTVADIGWLDVYFERQGEGVTLPVLNAEQSLALVSPGVKMENKSTKPPARFNDGSLIDELKKRGIGRPSTYAAILSKITDRNYVQKEKNHLKPTDIGKEVIDDLKEHFSFMDYKYTSDMESNLDKIANKNMTYLELMNSFYNSFKNEFHRAKNSTGMISPFPCPKCGDKTVVRHGYYGFFAGCIRYPDCDGTLSIKIEGDELKLNVKEEVHEDVKCPKCNSSMIRKDGKFGPYYSCSKYPKCRGKRKISTGILCNKCGKNDFYVTVYQGKPKLACMGYPNCKNVIDVPEDVEIDWKPPTEVAVQKMPSKVEKLLKV